MKDIFLFDSLKDPRDMAQIIHLGLALGLKSEFTGSSIQTNHPKVVDTHSWIKGFKKNLILQYFNSPSFLRE